MGRKLNRDTQARKALFRQLVNSLFVHGWVKTTEAKAKAIRGLVDKLITQGKQGTLHSQRLVASFLQNKKSVEGLLSRVVPLTKSRQSGFTRIIRLGQRQGDQAMEVKLELVDGKNKPAVKK
jgi:large subunit ribosomal protein L17